MSTLARWLQHVWWRPPGIAARLLQPLSWLYRALTVAARLGQRPEAVRPVLPVIVVGNLIVGGAGKTPTVIALAGLLASWGFRPGVVSRGHGRRGGGVHEVRADSDATRCGDEPLLIRRRTGVPVWVGRDRVAAGRALLAAHPQVDLLLADDGLQHRRLARSLQVVVFDDRGVGNGFLLPAGPLRERLPAQVPAGTLVLYNAAVASTPLPGWTAERSLAGVQTLAQWRSGASVGVDSAAGVRRLQRPGHRWLAVAGIAVPERFFAMLEHAGFAIDRLPLADHASFDPLPWPVGTPDVLLTEKDAVKLAAPPPDGTRVWVVTLDFRLPDGFVRALRQHLPAPSTPATPP